MNLTALTLLQGRLFDMATQSGAEIRRLRDAGVPTCSDQPEWFDATRRSQSELLEFFERRLSTALRALERIDNGQFGACERCDESIDDVQLFVRPDRLTCGACTASQGDGDVQAPTLDPRARSHEVFLRRV